MMDRFLPGESANEISFYLFQISAQVAADVSSFFSGICSLNFQELVQPVKRAFSSLAYGGALLSIRFIFSAFLAEHAHFSSCMSPTLSFGKKTFSDRHIFYTGTYTSTGNTPSIPGNTLYESKYNPPVMAHAPIAITYFGSGI